MKNTFQIIKVFILFFALLSISGCEKDLYEEAIQLPERQSKINYVTIDQVPFLIPEIQEFNHDYDYLTSTSKSINKDALNLNLDLNKILEYVTANGLKSYSIKIKNQFEEYDDKYFENLSIYEKDGELQSFILKYNSIEDDKEFDYNTFTGEINLYNLEKDLAGIIQYENGENKCIKIVVGGWHIVDFGGGDLYCWYEGGSGSGGASSGGSAGSGTGGTGGTGTGGTGTGGTIGTGSSGSGSSGTGGTGSGHTGGGSGGSSPVTANPVRLAEQWIYNLDTNSLGFCSEQFFSLSTEAQTLMINYIIQNNYTGTNLNSAKLYLRTLIKNPNGAFNFLIGSSTQTQTNVFNYLIQNNFNTQSTNFVNQCINQMMNNPGLELDIDASSKSPMNIDRNAIDNNTPEGQKFNQIYDKLSDVPEFKTLFTDLFGPNNRINVKFQLVTDLPDNVLGQTGKEDQNGPNTNLLIKINKSILSQNSNIKRNNMEIVKTILHECIHAYLVLKALYPTLGQPIPSAENLTLSQLTNLLYPISPFNPNQQPEAQHQFIFDQMIPTMENILSQLLPVLTTNPKRIQCEATNILQQQWQWSKYIHYISLRGLEWCDSMISQYQLTFPNGEIHGVGIEFSEFTQYDTTGHTTLDYTMP